MMKPNRVYILKTSRGGRPKTFVALAALLEAVKWAVIDKREIMGAGRLIIEVKLEKPKERS